MNKIQKKRLLKLADFLESVPRKNFDLDHIVYINNDPNGLLSQEDNIKDKMLSYECGSAACAIGWMPAVFPRKFKWESHYDYNLICVKEKGKPPGHFDFDFLCANKWFGLTRDQSYYLFTAETYPKNRRGPKSVSKRIRSFVKNDGVMKQGLPPVYW